MCSIKNSCLPQWRGSSWANTGNRFPTLAWKIMENHWSSTSHASGNLTMLLCSSGFNKGNTCPAWSEHYDPVTATAVTCYLWKETPFTTVSCVQNMLGNQEKSRSLEWLIKFRSFCSRVLPVLPTILCTKKVSHCGWRWAVGWFNLRKVIFSIHGNKPRKRLPWKIMWHQNIDYSRLQLVSKKKPTYTFGIKIMLMNLVGTCVIVVNRGSFWTQKRTIVLPANPYKTVLGGTGLQVSFGFGKHKRLPYVREAALVSWNCSAVHPRRKTKEGRGWGGKGMQSYVSKFYRNSKLNPKSVNLYSLKPVTFGAQNIF